MDAVCASVFGIIQSMLSATAAHYWEAADGSKVILLFDADVLLRCASHHEQMSATNLIDSFEDIYTDMARVFTRCSWSRPQR